VKGFSTLPKKYWETSSIGRRRHGGRIVTVRSNSPKNMRSENGRPLYLTRCWRSTAIKLDWEGDISVGEARQITYESVRLPSVNLKESDDMTIEEEGKEIIKNLKNMQLELDLILERQEQWLKKVKQNG
jgi:hypothetical protein